MLTVSRTPILFVYVISLPKLLLFHSAKFRAKLARKVKSPHHAFCASNMNTFIGLLVLYSTLMSSTDDSFTKSEKNVSISIHLCVFNGSHCKSLCSRLYLGSFASRFGRKNDPHEEEREHYDVSKKIYGSPYLQGFRKR